MNRRRRTNTRSNVSNQGLAGTGARHRGPHSADGSGDFENQRLSSDDFQRLGVQPQECRLTVIRRAAARRAKALADKQLTAPTDRADRQLTQVATSAYRLMDPRMRANSHQRVFVGRILPNVLMWAGRTQFSIGGADGAVTAAPMDDDDAPYIDLPSGIPPLATGIDLGSSLTQSLDSDDLVNRSHLQRLWLRTQTQIRRPGVALSLLAAVLLGSTVGFKSAAAWYSTRAKSAAAAIEDVGQEVSQPSPSKVVRVSEVVPATKDFTEVVPQAERPPIPTDVQANPAVPPLPTELKTPEMQTGQPAPAISSPAAPPLPTDLTATTDPPKANDLPTPTDPVPPADTDQNVPAKPPVPTDLSPLDGPPMPTEVVDQYPFLDDPFESPKMETADSDSPKAEPTEQDDRVIVPPKVHDVPDDQSIASLRPRLIKLVPELDGRMTMAKLPIVIDRLTEIRKDLNPGGEEYWAVGLMLGEVTWLAGNRDQVVVQLQPLADHYDAPMSLLLAAAFQSQLDIEETIDIHEVRFQAGIRLMDELILDEKVSLANDIAKTVARSTELLQDDDATATLKRFEDLVDQLERQQATVEKLADRSPDDVSADDPEQTVTLIESGIMGRYYCLALRNWATGLPWLSKGSDARLATLAASELALPKFDSADPQSSDQATSDQDAADQDAADQDAADQDVTDQWRSVAERWVAASERVDGRPAESMQMHAATLLRSALANSTGLRKLEMERLVETIDSKLPFYCLTATNGPAETTSIDPKAPDVDAVPATKTSRFSGRLKVDGKDIGVGLNYEPPMAITDRVFQQIKEKLRLDFDQMTIQLAGEIELKEPADVMISCAKDLGELKQTVTVGGKVVRLDDGQSTTQLTLAAGKHKMQWVMTGDHFPRVFLDVRHADSKQPIQVVAAYNPGQDDVTTVLTVEMIANSH